MGKTNLMVVNDAADPEAVTVDVVCREVVIGEDRSVVGWPTTDYQVYVPEMTDTPIQVQAGKLYSFVALPGNFYYPDDVIGYVAAVSGSTTFSVDQH